MKIEETSTIDRKQLNQVRDAVQAQAHEYTQRGKKNLNEILDAFGGWNYLWFIPIPMRRDNFSPEAQLNKDY